MNKKLNYFYFEKIGRRYFISLDDGEWMIISEKDFRSLKAGKPDRALLLKLEKNNLLSEKMDFKSYFEKFSSLKEFTFASPSLHIIVLTLACNHRCVYCRAVDSPGRGSSMTARTAKKTLEFIFSSPSKALSIEFQGGEALINWEVLSRSVDMARSKAERSIRDLELSVVTNLSLMTEEKMKFLLERGVSICTSLDGPADVHDSNRLFSGGSSHALAVKWLKRIKKETEKNYGRKDSLPSALMTTTRFSLEAPERIIEQYRDLGLGGIFLRPLSPIGYAKSVWDKIGYLPADFLSFYEKALDIILEINRKGEKFIERNAAIKLKKLLFCQDPNFLDLRSPCGAASGQLAYNWDGSIYTCDEGRMTGAAGDDFFKLGDVFSSTYRDAAVSPGARLCAMCSCLENQPACFRCAFKHYCGICPVHNYETSSTPWGRAGFGGWCEIEKGIFKILLEKMKDDRNMKIFLGWFS